MVASLIQSQLQLKFASYDEYQVLSKHMPRVFSYDRATRIWSIDIAYANRETLSAITIWLQNVQPHVQFVLDGRNVDFEEFKNAVKALTAARCYYAKNGKLYLLREPEPYSLLDTITHRAGKNEKQVAFVPDTYATRRLVADEFEIEFDEDAVFNSPLKGTVEQYELPDFLLEHQVEGVEWIIGKINAGYPGVILADEMGLGKTVQALTVFFALKDKVFDKLVIIANKSTVLNAWTNDMLKFFGTRPEVVDSLDFVCAQKGIYITNYEKLASMLSSVDSPCELSARTLLVLDEATKVKNQDTDNYKSVVAIRGQAFVLALTGTPVENNIAEYYSILTVVCPFFMPKYVFNRIFVVFKERKIRGQVIKTIEGHRNVELFYELAKPFVLRRTKEVLDNVPAKEITAVHVWPTEEQERLIETIRERAAKKYNDEIGELAAIVIIRRILDDPKLLEMTDSELVRDIEVKDYTSPKYIALESILQKHKPPVVIFTEFEDMANILQERLSAKYKVAVISGQCSVKERNRIISDFSAGKYDIVIATDALAYGVNMQFVDVLINYDIPWNPGKRAQRINRIHRIGTQSKKYIYDIVAEGIEKAAYKIIVDKLDLFARAVEGKSIVDSSVFKQIAKNYFTVFAD